MGGSSGNYGAGSINNNNANINPLTQPKVVAPPKNIPVPNRAVGGQPGGALPPGNLAGGFRPPSNATAGGFTNNQAGVPQGNLQGGFPPSNQSGLGASVSQPFPQTNSFAPPMGGPSGVHSNAGGNFGAPSQVSHTQQGLSQSDSLPAVDYSLLNQEQSAIISSVKRYMNVLGMIEVS